MLGMLHTVFLKQNKLEKRKCFSSCCKSPKFFQHTIEKKSTYKWALTVQTSVVEGSTVQTSIAIIFI